MACGTTCAATWPAIWVTPAGCWSWTRPGSSRRAAGQRGCSGAQRRRSDQTLAALSQALGWPPGYLQAVAEGRTPDDPDADDPVLAELAAMKGTLAALTSRVDAIEQQLADGGEQP